MGTMMVVNGNKAAAYGAKLCRPDVMSAYPITPQTPLVEYLSQFVADGELDSEFVEVESEHSALSVLQGAALTGGRVFTGTSSQGLALMYEPYVRTGTLRLPIVMAIVTREIISPQTVWGGQQDAITVRDAGWIQIYVENNQEILDSIIQGFKIAEHPDVLLPVNVCYDGFYLSHMAEPVDIPDQELVDRFLPKFKPHVKLDPEDPQSVDPLMPGPLLMAYRYEHVQAMARAKRVIDEVDAEFGRMFGRSYGGLVEAYRMEDAEIAIVVMGSMAGTAKVAVDQARDTGIKVGLVKLRVLRPFPNERLVSLLGGVKAIGVMERNVCFGWNTGVVYMELRSALQDLGNPPPVVDFIAGLGGADITLDHFAKAIDMTRRRGEGEDVPKLTWMGVLGMDI